MRDYLEYLRIPYQHGVTDCYGLVRRFYSQELSIALPEYAYPESWNEQDPRLIMRLYRDAGFRRNRTPRFDYGNVILLNKGSHLGVIVEDGYFLHTLRQGTAIHPYTHGYWLSRIEATFTYARSGS